MSTPSTYDLIREADLLLSSCADLTPEEMDARLTAWIESSGDKVAALRAVIANAENRAAFFASEGAAVIAAAKQSTATAERLSRLLVSLLQRRRELGEDPTVRGPGWTVSLRAAEAVQVTDLAAIPPEYLRRKETVEPDKGAIKEALQAGKSVPGAALDKRETVSIRPAK